jgi:hypothetical protein
MSSLKHANFVEKSITELLDKHCITEVTHPFIVNPLTVSVSGSGKEWLLVFLPPKLPVVLKINILHQSKSYKNHFENSNF